MHRLVWVCVLCCVACGDDDGSSDAGSEAGSDVGSGVCTSDEQCSDDVFCNGAEICDPDDAAADSDGCVAASDPCMSGRTCDEAMDACLTDCELDPDADGDGVDSVECGGADCDDGDSDRFPGATEVCDGDDEDCDPATVGDTDADSDGFVDAACCNGDVCGDDCDDSASATFPGATEVCNAIDDDCDTSADEDLPTFAYVPDCDEDNFGGDGDPVMGCGPPAMAPPCASDGAWVTATGDCDDDDASRNPGNPEVCNGIDDDCDTDIDDIVDGVVVCMSGETGACTNACGVAGTGSCAADCLSFECSSELTEVCNYCDDDGDGSFDEDVALAGATEVDDVLSCPGAEAPVFGAAICDVVPTAPSGSQFLRAMLLDGTANDQAGAVWFTPSDWFVGWGEIDVEVTIEARTVPTMGAMRIETALGGWAIVLDSSGSPGVGPADRRGVPASADGVAANWFWSTVSSYCIGANPPPDVGDSYRLFSDQPLQPPGTMPSVWSCSDGDPTGPDLDSQTSFVRQTMRIRYTPDDPTTIPNEERAIVNAGGASTTWRADGTEMPRLAGELTPGAPLRIGITAGTFTGSGYDSATGLTFGVPVEAHVTLWRMIPPGGGGPPTFDLQDASVTRSGICP